MSTFEHRIAERRRPEATGESGRPAAAARARPFRSQQQFVAERRNESVLDKRIPLGVPPWGAPQQGMSVSTYYRAKHARGERGTYFPLHWTAQFR
jgi:hypothetical protein